MNSEINRALIFTYFSGRATALQKRRIDKWSADTSNLEQFYNWLQEWEQQNLQYAIDVDQGITKHWQRYDHHQHQPSEITVAAERTDKNLKNLFFWKLDWFVAASVLVTLCTGVWFFKENIVYQIYKTSYNETKRIELADGSKVVLNSNSSLSVPRFGFGTDTRNVLLKGEADFDVVHTRDHRKFIVTTSKDVNIVVLGTQFNVYARPRGTKVMLSNGKVQLRYQEGKEKKMLTMKPGDYVTMDVHGHANLEKMNNPQKFTSWKSHRFIFEKATMQEVGHLLEDNFGLKVLIPDSSVAQLTISGSFTALNGEELLDLLTDDSGLSYQKSPDGAAIILSY